jgi:hypothetical protein
MDPLTPFEDDCFMDGQGGQGIFEDDGCFEALCL